MSFIKPRPVAQKTAIMSVDEEAKYAKTFRDSPCESCGVNDGTVVGAHLNTGLGGTGYKAKGIMAGLCFRCHSLADGREKATKVERLQIWVKVCQKLLRDRAWKWRNDG